LLQISKKLTLVSQFFNQITYLNALPKTGMIGSSLITKRTTQILLII